MILIGISGKKRSGKDTFADFILENARGVAVKRSFADALKDEAAQMLNISRERIENEKSFFRPFLQWYGTEWRRGCFGGDYWIRQLKQRIELSAAHVIVVPDVRFQNEADLIRDMGGIVVRVERIGESHEDRHASETDLDGCPADTLITAESGDTEALRVNAAWLIDKLQERK